MRINIEPHKRVNTETLISELKQAFPNANHKIIEGAHTVTKIDKEGREKVVYIGAEIEIEGEIEETQVRSVIEAHTPERSDEEARILEQPVTYKMLLEILKDFERKRPQ